METTDSSGFNSDLKGLEFKDVCVDIADKRILWNVNGHAHSGAVLAVMGPSGSGKTTLLNGLSGQTSISSGHVTLNGQTLTKKLRRKVSYVLQQDIFFPNLTLRETLRYSALLRLPRELSFKEKLSKVEDIIKTLKLQDCANTFIGNALVRGLSGGEKKRTSIACEMLTDPVMLLLDEPTSGLDSSSALSLMHTLCGVARSRDKIIVASIHQPSSQLYHMFDDLLLLAKGKVAYFGASNSVISYFNSHNLHCTLHYNPADFIVEMVTQDESRHVLIGDDPKESPPSHRKWWQKLLWWNRRSSSIEKAELEGVEIERYVTSPRFPRKSSVTAVLMASSTLSSDGPIDNSTNEGGMAHGNDLSGRGHVANGGVRPYHDEVKIEEEEVVDVSGKGSPANGIVRQWPTAWWWQLCVLTVRTFRQSRHVILSKLNCIQMILMAILVGLVWFQLPTDERSIRDREGFLFFIVIYTNFFAFFTATFSFPAEHVVIAKERRSGSYHLSAYYLAKTISDLPLVVLLPSLFFTITYWASGINSFPTYFALLLVITISNIVGQGFGLLIGALFMNIQQSLVATTLILLGMLLLGGFYVERFPPWLVWARYTSYISYAYDAVQYWGFWNLEFTCDPETMLSVYEVCSNITGGVANITGGVATLSGGVSNMTMAMISSADVLEELGAIKLAWYWDLLIMVGFGLVLRIGAYLCLRFLHTKH